MRNLRISRKLNKPARRQMTFNARDIILSIFSQQTEAEKLEYSRQNWRSIEKEEKEKIEDSSLRNNYQPLLYLYPFLEKIANNVDIETCNFLFVDGNNLKIVHKEKRVVISKTAFSGSKLKYWLSHIYFSKQRKQISDRILTQPKATEREVVHVYEEKQYMPKVIRGMATQNMRVVRKLTVSNEGRFMRNSDKQKKPFCIVYNKNGSEEEFNFSQILSFVEYSFNVKDIIYIKIIPANVKDNIPISLRFCKADLSHQQMHRIVKFCHIYDRVQGWEFAYEEIQAIRLSLLDKKQFQGYCELLILEVVAFMKVKLHLEVQLLESEWVRTNSKGVILTNVSKFITSETKQKKAKNLYGLQTLYNKIFSMKTPRITKKSKQQNYQSKSDKRVKSQQKQSFNLFQIFNLPLATAEKPKKSSSRIEMPQTLEHRSKMRGKSQGLVGIKGLLT